MSRRANRSNTTKPVTFSATQPTFSATKPTYSAKTPRRVLRIRQVCEIVGLARSTVYAAIARGEFPAPMAILAGGRASGWSSDAIDSWLDARLADASPRLPLNVERAKAKAVAG
jgi:prophage regulatory protein